MINARIYGLSRWVQDKEMAEKLCDWIETSPWVYPWCDYHLWAWKSGVSLVHHLPKKMYRQNNRLQRRNIEQTDNCCGGCLKRETSKPQEQTRIGYNTYYCAATQSTLRNKQYSCYISRPNPNRIRSQWNSGQPIYENNTYIDKMGNQSRIDITLDALYGTHDQR